MLQLLLALALAAPDPRAAALLDSAMARMGGADALRKIERVRTENLTQWQRTTFESRPYADQPSYEWHSDVRDYTLAAWRNTRRYGVPGSAAQTREIVDVVRDTVAIRYMQGKWAPLNVAYVDERRELFAFAPERVLLLARAASDLRLLADTVIGGLPHARVGATIAGFPATLFLRRGDGLPAMVRWRAAQPNDFGLVEWGEMEAELWYSRWTPTRAGVALPMQLDVRRVGRPYKRVSVLAMAFDTVATADSFAVSDSLRSAYLATAVRPMHDVPLDSAKVVDGRFAAFGPWTSLSAVKVGGEWLLLETGQAPLVAGRAAEWLAKTDPGARVGGALVTATMATNGGVTWLAERKLPVWAAPGARPILATILRSHGQPAAAFTAVTRGQWLRVGGDSLWLEPLDLPDAPGAMLVYVPSLKWAYSALAASPLQAEYVVRALRARGWAVERMGSMRAVSTPAPASVAAVR